jgi:hypothetical protein
MHKKIMLLALAAVSAAMFALPAVASAETLHVSATGSFSISGGAGDLRTTSGLKITCTATSGSGVFTTTTGGNTTLTLHGCKDSFGFTCTGTGQPAGTIKLEYKFDLVTIEGIKSAGILMTPLGATEVTPGRKVLQEFTCFGLTTTVFGNGIVGTITAPACGGSSKTATLSFKHSATNGHQQHTKVTGVSYDLETRVGSGGEHTTSSLENTATITYTDNTARTLTCT